MENDVMFGKPSSRFNDLQDGLRAYRNGKVDADLYMIQSEVELDENGKIKLQIREIEPEVSAIFDVTLKRFVIAENTVAYTRSDFKGCVLVNKDDIRRSAKMNYSVTDKHGVEATKRLSYSTSDRNAVTLETDDYLDIAFKASSVEGTYLLLESWYRDWTLGEIYSEERAPGFVVSPYRSAMRTAARYTQRGLLATVVAVIAGYIGFNAGNKSDNTPGVLASYFGTNTANADHTSCSSCTSSNGSCSCRSLEVAYRNTATPQRYEVVEPRYARPSTVAVKVPAEALSNGTVNLRITATKRHKVSALAVVSAEEISENAYTELSLESAFHHREKKEYAQELKKPEAYIKTYPSDVVTLMFGTDEAGSQADEYGYTLSVGGVYAAATKKDQQVVGNWVQKLDEEALTFLSTVYKEARKG